MITRSNPEKHQKEKSSGISDLENEISRLKQIIAENEAQTQTIIKKYSDVNKTLFAISNAVNSSQTLSDLYQKIHSSLSAIIDVTNFAIALYDNKKDILSFPYMVDEKDDPHPDIENATQSGVLNAKVILSKAPQFLNKKEIIERQIKGCRKVGTNPEQWLGVPLITKNNVIGVLVVQSYSVPHLYTQEDLNMLVAISDQMAIAIDRKRAENELIRSEKRYRSMIESMTDPVYICSHDRKITYMNPKMIERLGKDRTGEFCYKALHGLDRQCGDCVFDVIANREMIETIIVSPLDDRHYRVTNMPIVNADETISKMSIYRDITEYVKAVSEKEKTQKLLIQSQKMESIGTLAGGIAHDFNNILSAILGYTELSLEAVEKETPLNKDLQEVYAAGLRAKELVSQILAFARYSEEEVVPIQVDYIIKEILRFLRSSIPTSIDIKQHLDSDSSIMGNATQVHQIIMNLCTNAAHAMEEKGGTLEITLKDIILNRDSGIDKLEFGDYLEIEVSDTGPGIDPHIIERIFEPYFTTKKTGEGTGMGLALVYGIVNSYGGKITVQSELGKGTAFIIHLPICESSNVNLISISEGLPMGHERILFVDDEVQIAELGSRLLGQLGYSVTTMTNSLEALELFQTKSNEFDLVISDVTMPEMTGDILANRLIQIRPDIPVILSTGYSKNISEEKALEIGVKAFTVKPIVKADLAKTVREVLDAAMGSHPVAL